jgi:hypothetical protein
VQHPSEQHTDVVADVEEGTERDELSSSVLGLIGAYGMGSALDARDVLVAHTSGTMTPPAPSTSR